MPAIAIFVIIICSIGIVGCIWVLVIIAKDLEKHKFDPKYFPPEYIAQRKEEESRKYLEIKKRNKTKNA